MYQLLFLFSFSFLHAFAQHHHGLDAMLFPSSLPSLLHRQSTMFQFILHNPSDQPVTLLKWGTPFENVDDSKYMRVVNAETGEPALYSGKLISRFLSENLFESINEFVTIGSDETISIDIDISKGYYLGSDNDTSIFNVSVDSHLSFFFGTFDDAINAPEAHTKGVLISHENLVLAPLKTDSLEMSVIPQLLPDPRVYLQNKHRNKLGISYTDCDSTKTSKFYNNVIPLAKQYNDRALSYMLNHRCDKLYVTYFGVYTASRWQLVTKHFQAIKGRLDPGTYTIKCEPCGYNAYVYPSDTTHTIHWCDLSWYNTFEGNAGTIIHELSHFSDVANTEDYAYYEATLTLAKSSPDHAVNNAASHSIFAQNSDQC